MHLPTKVNSLSVQTFMANKIPSDSEGVGDGAFEVKTRLPPVLSVTSGFHKRRSLLFCGLPFFYLAWARAKQLFGLLVAVPVVSPDRSGDLS